MKRLVTVFGLLLLHGSLSHAAAIINVSQNGGDVVATANGTINTDSFAPPTGGGTNGLISGTALGPNYDSSVYVGLGPDFDVYSFDTDIVFSTGNIFRANLNSGDFLGVVSANEIANFPDAIIVQDGYVSGAAISATSTWTGQTIAGMGLIPGTYLFTWGSGETADSLTVNINEVVPPPTYTVGGTVSGLTGSVTLQNNGDDDIIKTTNDSFTFPAQAEGTDYVVTVSSQPTGQTCSVTNGSGTIAAADVTNVSAVCVDDVVPPVEPPTPIPTMSKWALIILTMLLFLMVFANRRRLV